MSTRYYCGNQKLQPGSEVSLPADESRHLLKVMRGRPGQSVIAFGESGQFTATLTGTADRGIAILSIGEALPGPPAPSVELIFIIPWIKGGKTELLVQKLTELGSQRIIAFQARHEVVKGDDSKVERLRRVALEACKQCERIELPDISYASSLKYAFDECSSIPVSNRFLLHERHTDNLFSRLVGQSITQSRQIAVASGPEGGWHPDELDTVANDVVIASLGPRILRAETAPIVAAAAALAVAGDL